MSGISFAVLVFLVWLSVCGFALNEINLFALKLIGKGARGFCIANLLKAISFGRVFSSFFGCCGGNALFMQVNLAGILNRMDWGLSIDCEFGYRWDSERNNGWQTKRKTQNFLN